MNLNRKLYESEENVSDMCVSLKRKLNVFYLKYMNKVCATIYLKFVYISSAANFFLRGSYGNFIKFVY